MTSSTNPDTLDQAAQVPSEPALCCSQQQVQDVTLPLAALGPMLAPREKRVACQHASGTTCLHACCRSPTHTRSDQPCWGQTEASSNPDHEPWAQLSTKTCPNRKHEEQPTWPVELPTSGMPPMQAWQPAEATKGPCKLPTSTHHAPLTHQACSAAAPCISTHDTHLAAHTHTHTNLARAAGGLPLAQHNTVGDAACRNNHSTQNKQTSCGAAGQPPKASILNCTTPAAAAPSTCAKWYTGLQLALQPARHEHGQHRHPSCIL